MSLTDALKDNEMERLVGRKVRALRLAHRLSLQELAERTGLSVGYISQLERGLSSPSLRALGVISNVLDVSIGTLFPDVEKGRPKPHGPVLRRHERANIILWKTGITKEILTPKNPETDMDVTMFEMVIESGGKSGDAPFTHAGDEAGFVVEGELSLQVADAQYDLKAGDGFCFSSSTPHQFTNASAMPARIIWVNCRERDPQERYGTIGD